jgi:hypothetical protein
LEPTLIGAKEFLKGHSRFSAPSCYDLGDFFGRRR